LNTLASLVGSDIQQLLEQVILFYLNTSESDSKSCLGFSARLYLISCPFGSSLNDCGKFWWFI